MGTGNQCGDGLVPYNQICKHSPMQPRSRGFNLGKWEGQVKGWGRG